MGLQRPIIKKIFSAQHVMSQNLEILHNEIEKQLCTLNQMCVQNQCLWILYSKRLLLKHACMFCGSLCEWMAQFCLLHILTVISVSAVTRYEDGPHELHLQSSESHFTSMSPFHLIKRYTQKLKCFHYSLQPTKIKVWFKFKIYTVLHLWTKMFLK